MVRAVLEAVLDGLFPLRCPGCGAPGAAVCDACVTRVRAPVPAPIPPGIDAWASAFAYDGVARELVARVKYRSAHGAVDWLARAMAPLAPVPAPDVVTWAPTTPARRRARGFDHAELLARRTARLLRRPARPLLVRVDRTAQTGLPGDARRVGPRFAPRQRVPASVLLIDDVTTTGATLAGAAAALRAGGAMRIAALTAARTPSW